MQRVENESHLQQWSPDWRETLTDFAAEGGSGAAEKCIPCHFFVAEPKNAQKRTPYRDGQRILALSLKKINPI